MDYLILVCVGLVVVLSIVQVPTGWVMLVVSNLMANVRSFRSLF